MASTSAPPIGSPMLPMAPPSKKARSRSEQSPQTTGVGPPTGADRISVEADAAIAKRRAELRRLQQQHPRGGNVGGHPAPRSGLETDDTIARRRAELRRLQKGTQQGHKAIGGNLLAMARSQLAQDGGGSAALSHDPRSILSPGQGQGTIPTDPSPNGAARVRHSEIFALAGARSDTRKKSQTAPPTRTQGSAPPVQTGPPKIQTLQRATQASQPPAQNTQPPAQVSKPSSHFYQPSTQAFKPPTPQVSQPPTQKAPPQTAAPPTQTGPLPIQTTSAPTQTMTQTTIKPTAKPTNTVSADAPPLTAEALTRMHKIGAKGSGSKPTKAESSDPKGLLVAATAAPKMRRIGAKGSVPEKIESTRPPAEMLAVTAAAKMLKKVQKDMSPPPKEAVAYKAKSLEATKTQKPTRKATQPEKVVRRLDPSFAADGKSTKSTSAAVPSKKGEASTTKTNVPTAATSMTTTQRAKSAPPQRPPPPPRAPPPKKAAEAPESGEKSRRLASRPPPMTPDAVQSASKTNIISSTSTSSSGREHRDLLRNLRQYADTPQVTKSDQNTPMSNNHESTTILRLQEKLLSQEKEKTEALRKVARLEGELQQERESKESSAQTELETLVQLADAKGETSAVQWARGIVSGSTPRQDRQVGFFSPLDGQPGSPVRSLMSPIAPSAGGVRKRVATPHPKRAGAASKSSEDEYALFVEATKSTPHEYTTDLATFTIRRPYGYATERELWFDVGQLNSGLYERKSDVRKPSTLEVAAHISADGSLFTLFGGASVRHRSNDDSDWKEFGDVDELDKPLGSVSFIDSDANEKDYSLDEIFEGVVAAREHYCSSILSMTVALQDRKAQEAEEAAKEAAKEAEMRQQIEYMKVQLEKSVLAAPQGEQEPISTSKPPTADACVGTEDMKFPEDKVPEEKAKKALEKKESKAEVTKKKIPQEPPPPEDQGASDVLSFFVGSFFSTLFWIVWTVLVRVPLRVFSFAVFTLIACTILSLLWLQFADDHGAYSMGAGIDFMHTRPGIL